MTRNFGFIYEEPKAEDYIFGDAQIAAEPLQPDGQWDAYLPEPELQNKGTFEPFACASFGTDNAIEILLNKKYGFTDNFSDRYLAYQTGTQFQRGNSPHVVAEFLRKNGNCNESDWPFSDDIDTFEKYYAPTPIHLVPKARKLIEYYTFKHDYVPNDPKSMKEALKYSPLGMSVFGWELIDNGLYGPGNGRDNHWVVCYGYEEGKWWKVFDSYDNTKKCVAWSHRPLTVKRYHIELTPQTVSWIQSALKALREALASLIAMKPPQPKSRITDFCLFIKTHEGWYPGSRSQRNNNPGNCRYSSVGYLPIYEPVGKDKDNFAIFKDYATGFLYLQNLVKSKIAKNPEWTLHQFFQEYAPASDGNDTFNYAKKAAEWLKVPVSTRIKDLL